MLLHVIVGHRISDALVAQSGHQPIFVDKTINKPETEVRIDLDLSHEELDATILEEVRGNPAAFQGGHRDRLVRCREKRENYPAVWKTRESDDGARSV